MPGKHKRFPISLRLPEPLRLRFDAYLERTGRNRNAVLVEATRDYLDRTDPSAPGQGATPKEQDR